jgi:hypothetical protein
MSPLPPPQRAQPEPLLSPPPKAHREDVQDAIAERLRSGDPGSVREQVRRISLRSPKRGDDDLDMVARVMRQAAVTPPNRDVLSGAKRAPHKMLEIVPGDTPEQYKEGEAAASSLCCGGGGGMKEEREAGGEEGADETPPTVRVLREHVAMLEQTGSVNELRRHLAEIDFQAMEAKNAELDLQEMEESAPAATRIVAGTEICAVTSTGTSEAYEEEAVGDGTVAEVCCTGLSGFNGVAAAEEKEVSSRGGGRGATRNERTTCASRACTRRSGCGAFSPTPPPPQTLFALAPLFSCVC